MYSINTMLIIKAFKANKMLAHQNTFMYNYYKI